MKVNDLTITIHGKTIINDLSFEFNTAGKLLIVGKNGAGKSTLMKVLVGMVKPSKGKVIHNETIGYVPDSSEKYFVGMSPEIYFNFLRINTSNSVCFDTRLISLIKKYSFSEGLMKKKINDLSLGEQKKVMIIGAFLLDPSMYLMDEPLSGLDKKSAETLIEMIDQLTNEGRKFIIISHDDNEKFSPINRTLMI
ncbi:ATP-binding cassette domain-containing protein [Enterococcus casseliflavus]|nr:ATP-binding cassette domain-containing protein [Enterococcus casseliflavus]